MLALPPEAPVIAASEPAGETPEVMEKAVATSEVARPAAARGPARWDDSTVSRLAKLVVELE